MDRVIKLSGVEQFFSSKSDEWGTPRRIFSAAESVYGVVCDFDFAASPTNAKCAKWSGDSLGLEWGAVARVGWLNPPFSLVDEFVQKALDEVVYAHMNHTAFTVVMCLKNAPETVRFRRLRQANADIINLSPRVQYEGAGDSCPFPSCLVRVGTDLLQYGNGSRVRWLDWKNMEVY